MSLMTLSVVVISGGVTNLIFRGKGREITLGICAYKTKAGNRKLCLAYLRSSNASAQVDENTGAVVDDDWVLYRNPAYPVSFTTFVYKPLNMVFELRDGVPINADCIFFDQFLVLDENVYRLEFRGDLISPTLICSASKFLSLIKESKELAKGSNNVRIASELLANM